MVPLLINRMLERGVSKFDAPAFEHGGVIVGARAPTGKIGGASNREALCGESFGRVSLRKTKVGRKKSAAVQAKHPLNRLNERNGEAHER